jgi:hypothetical protein
VPTAASRPAIVSRGLSGVTGLSDVDASRRQTSLCCFKRASKQGSGVGGTSCYTTAEDKSVRRTDMHLHSCCVCCLLIITGELTSVCMYRVSSVLF